MKELFFAWSFWQVAKQIFSWVWPVLIIMVLSRLVGMNPESWSTNTIVIIFAISVFVRYKLKKYQSSLMKGPCPSCGKNITISDQNNQWTCPHCDQTFTN